MGLLRALCIFVGITILFLIVSEFRLQASIANITSSKDSFTEQSYPEREEDKFSKNIFEKADYVRDVFWCEVEVFDVNNKMELEKQSLDKQLLSRNPRQLVCSPQVFREYFRDQERFYGDGYWTSTSSIDLQPERVKFFPATCDFNESVTERENLGHCLRRSNVWKLTVSGDSNGERYFEAIVNIFSHRSKCKLDTERGIEDLGTVTPYFKVPGQGRLKRQVICKNCTSKVFHCSGGIFRPNEDFVLEFIGIYRFIEWDVHYEPPESLESPQLNKTPFVEYLLRYYFPYRGFPDLWVIQPPTHHEVNFVHLPEFHSEFSRFVQLMDKYLPSSSKVLMLTDSRECANKRPIWVRRKFRHFWKSARERNEIFHAMNQVIFEVLKDKLQEPGGKYLGFLDVGKITCPFTCRWHADGGHMVPGAYHTIWRYLFMYWCAGI